MTPCAPGHGGVQVHLRAGQEEVDPHEQQPLHAGHQGRHLLVNLSVWFKHIFMSFFFGCGAIAFQAYPLAPGEGEPADPRARAELLLHLPRGHPAPPGPSHGAQEDRRAQEAGEPPARTADPVPGGHDPGDGPGEEAGGPGLAPRHQALLELQDRRLHHRRHLGLARGI